jgi:hypothetical protein
MNNANIIYPSEEFDSNYITSLRTEFVRQIKTRTVAQSRYETALNDDVVISRLFMRIILDENE